MKDDGIIERSNEKMSFDADIIALVDIKVDNKDGI